MEKSEEVFNTLGLSAEKYAAYIDFLCKKIHGYRHHEHLQQQAIDRIQEMRNLTGDLFTGPSLTDYPGDFNRDWEDKKREMSRKLNTYPDNLTIDQKIELMLAFKSELIKIKNSYLKEADKEVITAYYEFMKGYNSGTES